MAATLGAVASPSVPPSIKTQLSTQPSPQGTSPARGLEDWKQLSVKAFFGRCRWSNQVVSPLEVNPDVPLVLDYRLTVGQFFGAVPWQGEGRVLSATPAGTATGGAAIADLPEGGDPLLPELPELPDLGDFEAGSGAEIADLTLDDFLGAFSGEL